MPGLVLALLYMKVRDYRTVAMTPALNAQRESLAATIGHIGRELARVRTVRWVCIAASAQLVSVSALWAWLPSFLNRMHGVAPAQAGAQAALVVLAGAVGAVVWVPWSTAPACARRGASSPRCCAVRLVDGRAGVRLRPGAGGDAVPARRARRLPRHLRHRAGDGDRHRCRPPRRAGHRLGGAGADAEPVRPGHRARARRNDLRHLGPSCRR
ncbi:MAG: hypothetical protein U1F25_16955 [Rubrivivax sp.]